MNAVEKYFTHMANLIAAYEALGLDKMELIKALNIVYDKVLEDITKGKI